MYKIEVEDEEQASGFRELANREELPAHDVEIEHLLESTEVYATHPPSGHCYRARSIIGPYGIVWLSDSNEKEQVERLIAEIPEQYRGKLDVLMNIAYQLGYEAGWDKGCEHIQSGGGHLRTH